MISDEDLLLYYYRELEPTERARIGAALGEQPELSRRLHTLIARLDSAAAIPDVPVPEHAQQRWAAALDRARSSGARAAQPRSRFFARTGWLAAAAAAVLAVALIFVFQQGKQSPAEQMANNPAPASIPGVSEPGAKYEHGLKWHLASTEQQLASLVEATPDERAKLVETIISQNRMYALAAERAGEPQLARVLRAFTPILENVAGGHAETAASVAQLSFELRVMQARLGADAAAPSNTL
jgi:negative regulator of sigma E activity